MPTANAAGAADLIDSFAAILWPAVVLAGLLLFKTELRELLRRLLKLKAAGIEVELDEAREAASAAKVAVEPNVAPQTTGTAPEEPPDEEPPTGTEPSGPEPRPRPSGSGEAKEGRSEARIDRPTISPARDTARPPRWGEGFNAMILEEASRSPKAALISLAGAIERVSREVLVSQGHPVEARAARSLRQHLRLIDLSPPVERAAQEFQEIRNRIVHGGGTDEDALRAIDIGLDVWDALSRIPREVNYVLAPAVDTFSDEKGERPHPFKAVVLAAEHPPDGDMQVRAFPIARQMPPPGEPVTWEWNLERIYPESWYRDPTTNDIKYGWTEAGEFAGHPIHYWDFPSLRESDPGKPG